MSTLLACTKRNVICVQPFSTLELNPELLYIKFIVLAVSSKYYENGGLRLDQAIYKNFTIFSSDYLLYSRVTTVNLKYEVNYHL